MESSSSQKENPLNIWHLKILRIFLWSLGAWPGETLDEKIHLIARYFRVHLAVQTTFVLSGEVNYFVKHFKDLDFMVLGDIIVTSFLTALTLFRALLPNFKNYGVIARHFFFTFHLIHFKDKGVSFMEMYKTIHKISHYFTWFTLVVSAGGMVLFNFSPMCNNYRNGAFSNNIDENTMLEFAVYYSFPGFNPEDNFLLTTIFNLYLSYCCTIVVCFIDLLLIIMVFQIIGHILVLSKNLKSIPKPKHHGKGERGYNVILFNDEENVNIRKQISVFVEHHKLIVSFTDGISNFFGYMLAFNYCYHSVSCCLLLLECSRGDLNGLARFGPLTFIIFGQLIQISVIFEIVNTVSAKLKDCVYEMPWECMNVSNQRSVCLLLNRMQTPINVTAMGMTTVGVQTMAGILKTTFSYFAFLRSMNE